MKKVIGHENRFCLPWTQAILGSHFEDKVNFMALNRFTRVNFNPPMIGICVNKSNASHAAIHDKGEFSINVPSVDMVEVTDYIGQVSAKRVEMNWKNQSSKPKLSPGPILPSKIPRTISMRA